MGKAKTLNNVVINMTLKSTQTRAKLSTSSEDLAVQMGKINKWYDSLVPTGGASGNILEWDSDGVAKWVAPSFLDEKVKSTLLAQSTAEGSYRPTFVTGAGTGGVNIIDSFKVDHTPGTTSAVGNTRLILGNATASGTANNEEGQLKLYSSGTSFHTLKGTTVSSEVIHVLPSTGGTILNDRTTTYTQTVASSVTGAYEIGKIKINGTPITIYGHDVDTTYTASDGIKIESNVIKHTNSIPTASSVFKKISYDAQGHITGTANVVKGDIPPLDYIVKPGQVGSPSRPIYINNSSIPTQCDTPASGAYWTGVPYVGANGVMEIGKYIDFHGTNTTTADYDYRIQAGSTWLDLVSPTTKNTITVISPDYSVIQFQTTKTGYTITQPVIYAYPLTTSGLSVLFQSGGNTVIGGGESASMLYANDYDSMTTAENESLYLASDSSEIHLITNAQSYGTRKVLKVADGQLVKTGGMWINARDTAPVYANKQNTQDGSYYPAWFAKTKSGGWSMGVLSTYDNLYITYTTDTDYSGGSNTNTYQVQFQNKSGTVALTSDIPAADDHKVTQNNLTSGGTFPVILGGNGSAATVTDYVNKRYDALRLGVVIGTTSTDGYGELIVGNSTASGTAGNTYGQISLYSSNTAGAVLRASSTTSWRAFYFPGDKGGTVAVTTDLAAYLPLSGGTMTGDISFAAISPSSYPAASKGIKWSGGTDAIDMYYNLRASDAGELIINMRDDANVRTSFAYNGTVKSYIDTNGTYNGNATTSSRSSALYTTSIGSSSSTHAGALQTYFEANKSTIVRNQGLGYYSSAHSNGSFYFGYFLGGYDSNPYGGFFVCNYNTPYYVGIQNGTYVEHKLLTDQNYTSYITQLGTVSKGSTTKGIYLDAGVPKEMTYSLNSTVNSGTANCIAYYSGANAISSAAKVTYVNANNSASTPATVAGLHIESPTYGNTAANMLGGVAGVFSYGDGGPQIRFKDGSSTQAGALIFTADDSAAAGTSWHFVSNESDWNVISKRFHAKTSISIGTDKPSTSYNLTVNGTSYFNNTITIKGTSSGNASINYASYGNARNYASIKFYDGADHGNGVQVGGGGLTVIGGGESAQAVFDNLSTLGWSASDEVAVVASDGPIYFMTNCDAFANRKSINIDTAGYLNTSYINMNVSDQDSTFSTASSIIYSNSDKYLRRVSLTKLGSTLGPYVGPYVTNVSDGSVIHQNNYNSAGTTRPVHRFIRPLRTNKLAFTPPANITMEYSTNSGSSWTSFGYTDAEKAGPFLSRHFAGAIAIGPASSAERTTSMQTRITITNDGRDCFIDQFYIWMSTSGHGTTVDIQYTTQSAKTTWVDWRTGVGLAGWSGPNVINVSELRYGGTIYSIRFIFKITSVSADYKTQRGTIYDIQAYGAMACWTSKNNMMMHDSLFTWDHEQVATFPAEVKVHTQLRVYHGNYGTILRSDGSDTYILLTNSGSAESGTWNNLRPFQISNSTGMVYLKEGAQVSSSSYGALSVIRTGSANAGIKFYNNGSTYLGSLALGSANGTFVRFKTDESTAYEIIDRSIVRGRVTTVQNLGWTSSNDTILPTINTIAYWNGAYSGTSSNLAYCNKGAFGSIVTHAEGDYVLKSGDTMNANTSITIPYGTGNIIYDGGTGLGVHAPTNSGWARGIEYTVGSTWYGGFGANGGAGTFDSLYIGKYNDKTVQIDPINKITTFNGVVNLMADQYDVGATTKTALNCHNSNITGVNSLIFNDTSDNASEGIMFYRSATPSWDVIWAKDGLLHFSTNHPTSSDDLSIGFTITSSTTDAWSSIGVGLYSTEKYQLKVIRTDGGNTYPSWMGWNYSPAIAFGGFDTKGVISMHYTEPGVMFIGGQNDSNHTKPNWNFGISGTSGVIYNLANMLTTTTKYAGSGTVGGGATTVTTIVSGGVSTGATDYGILFAANPSTAGDNNARKTYDLRYQVLEGTTSQAGRSELVLGNSKSSTTAGNKYGQISIYSASTSYHTLKVVDTSSVITHTFPATSGTVLNSGTTSFTRTLTSGTKIGAIKINGTSTDIYAPTNTDVNVTQTATTTNADYEVLFSYTADNTTRTETARKNSNLKFNPSTGSLYASKYYGEFECLNEVVDNVSFAMVLALHPDTHEPNTLRKTPNAVVSFKNGTASEEGWAQITLGNETKSGTAGNSTGWLKLFSSNTGFHYITGASTTSGITHTLPAVSGTVLNSGNYLQYTRSIQKLYAATSTKGWRRILTIPAMNSSGYTIGRYEFHFTRQWNNGAPESFGVRVICNYTTPVIHLLYAEQNSQILTDFRVARSSDSTKIHFEVWYNATTKNDFSVRYVIQDPQPIPHDYCTFPTETDGSSPGSSFLPVVSDNPTGQATIAIPLGGISQFNLRQVTGSYGGYFGMADAAGSDSAWIRTTSQGLLPHQSGDATSGGHCNLGTSGWYFGDAYINRVYGNTADFECFQPRHSNEFSMKEMASYTYVWFNYRLITDDKQGYTTEPTRPINQYWFGCGKARNALAKVVTSGMIIYPGAANTTSYSTTLQSSSLTANRTATLPNATGTIPLITEKYNSPSSTATGYNLTNAKTFKYLIITTKPSGTFGSTTTIVEAPTSATITKTAVSYSDNSSESSPPTRMLSGIIQVNYTDESNCIISTSHATHYIQAGSAVASNSASSVSIYITRIVGVSY